MNKPILQTARLSLVPFEPEDVQLLHRSLTDAYIRRYLMDDEVIPFERSREFISLNEKTFQANGWGLWKIIVAGTGSYAGFAGLWSFFNEPQPQLLYALLEHHTRKGYAVEASEAIMEYAFATLRFNYLVAASDTPNTASQKVCERLNFKKVDEKLVDGHPVTFFRIEAPDRTFNSPGVGLVTAQSI